jgi:hypothetical protein
MFYISCVNQFSQDSEKLVISAWWNLSSIAHDAGSTGYKFLLLGSA